MKRYFEFVGEDTQRQTETSGKFWEITVNGPGYVVRFGKLGVTGQTTEKSFASAEEAQKAADKLIAEKTKKGYVEK